MNFFKIIEQIEKKPEMFFSQPISLALLEAFVVGYMASSEGKKISGKNGLNFDYFNSWLTGAVPNTLPENYILSKRIEYVSDNNNEAVKLFFDLIKKFSTGLLKIENQETKPIILKWSQGTGNMKLEEFQKIEETIVRFEIISHEFSKTKFKIGYNENDFRIYVEPFIGNEILHVLRYTENKITKSNSS